MTIMTTVDFITELFSRVEEKVDDRKHPQAKLYPSEVITLAMLYALKGCGQLGAFNAPAFTVCSSATKADRLRREKTRIVPWIGQCQR